MAPSNEATDFEQWLVDFEMEDEDARANLIEAVKTSTTIGQYACKSSGRKKILSAYWGTGRELIIANEKAEKLFLLLVERYDIFEEDELEEGFRRNMESEKS